MCAEYKLGILALVVSRNFLNQKENTDHRQALRSTDKQVVHSEKKKLKEIETLPIPRPILLLVGQLLWLCAHKLKFRPLQAMPSHHLIHTIVPLSSEDIDADRFKVVPVYERSKIEAVSVDLGCAEIQARAGSGLLEDEDGKAVVWCSFLSVWRQPGKNDLLLGVESGKRHASYCGGDGDVNGEKMAAVIESVLFLVWHVWVDYYNGH